MEATEVKDISCVNKAARLLDVSHSFVHSLLYVTSAQNVFVMHSRERLSSLLLTFQKKFLSSLDYNH